MAHRLRSAKACGIFPDQATSPGALHWQVDPQPLDHEGSPNIITVIIITKVCVLSQSVMSDSLTSQTAVHQDPLSPAIL